MRFFLVSLFLLLPGLADAQHDDLTIIKDLAAEWKVYENNQYQDFDPSKSPETIHFYVDANLYSETFLRIESRKEFSVFIGEKLIASHKSGVVLYSLDSLADLYSPSLDFSVRKPVVKMMTQLVMKTVVAEQQAQLIKRKDQYFLNFSIIAALCLLSFFVILLRTNPRLTSDYLNFIKLFSLQEREESIMALRVTSSVNLVFYSFAGFLTAFLLLVIFHFVPAEIRLAAQFPVYSLEDCFIQWILLTALITLLLMCKLILISIFSNLYNASEIIAIQFFNFIRLFFFTFGLLACIVIIFFMAGVTNPGWYYNLFYLAVCLFIFWELVIFLKLMARLPFRIFHLFFYLCASEFIPFIILLKVVF